MEPQKNMVEQTSALNDEQIVKIEEVLKRLAVFSRNNASANVLSHNMRMSKDFNEKRKWVTMIYAQNFQLLSMINMAIQNKDTIQDFENKLNDLFQRKDEPTKR